jgi:hypothetical protein
MEKHMHRMTELFVQLGLPSSPLDIQNFIDTHSDIPAQVALHDAPCWNTAQADFLREKICEDADWAIVIDALDSALRKE